MSKECEKISKFSGKISKPAQKLRFEIDESYFGSKRVRGKRGRGAANKTPVFNFAQRRFASYRRLMARDRSLLQAERYA